MPKDTTTAANGEWRLPAEWEAQDFVQLTWPHRGTDWLPTIDEITATYVQMAKEIARRERLLIVAPDPEEALEAIRREWRPSGARPAKP